MVKYYKQFKTTKGVNTYLRKLGLGDFQFDSNSTFEEEFDFDGWVNSKETKGASILVTKAYEVFVTRYTREEIEELNAAIA